MLQNVPAVCIERAGVAPKAEGQSLGEQILVTKAARSPGRLFSSTNLRVTVLEKVRRHRPSPMAPVGEMLLRVRERFDAVEWWHCAIQPAVCRTMTLEIQLDCAAHLGDCGLPL